MKETIQKAISDMSSKIERDSKHIYVNKETRERLQGVSTVSGIVPKDWLAAWGAKEAVKYLGYSDYKDDIHNAEQILDELKHATLKEYLEILKTAKGACARKSKQALLDGKEGHSWLELFVESRIEGRGAPILPSGLLERPITQFLDWQDQNIDHWIASEGLVCNLPKFYAGQFDAIAKLKSGWLALIDFKFSSHISEDYRLQCRGYQACFEPYGIKFDTAIIIRLPKTLEQDSWNPKTFTYSKVANDIEVKHFWAENYEFDKNAFFAALVLKSWINKVVPK